MQLGSKFFSIKNKSLLTIDSQLLTSHDFRKAHFIISFQLGFFPYIKIPVR